NRGRPRHPAARGRPRLLRGPRARLRRRLRGARDTAGPHRPRSGGCQMSALSTAGLLRAHLRSGLGAAALTATLVAVTVFVAAAVPSALAALTTAQLQHAASELSAARRDLTASGPLGPRFAELVSATNTIADITDQVEIFPRQYGEPLESVLGAGEWVGVTRLFTVNPEDPAPGAPSISVNLAI